MGPKANQKSKGKAAPRVKRLQSKAKLRAAATSSAAEEEQQLPVQEPMPTPPTMQQFNDLKDQIQVLTNSLAAREQNVVPSTSGAMINFFQGESSPFSTLGANLDSKLMAKIISGQYVDLLTLEQEEEKVLHFDLDSAQWVMGQKANKKIQNIFQWIRLFGTYSSIYLAAHPSLGPAFMTYMVRIMDMHKQYGGKDTYLRYDVRFRQLIAKKENAPHLAWEKLEMSIVYDCLAGSAPLLPATSWL